MPKYKDRKKFYVCDMKSKENEKAENRMQQTNEPNSCNSISNSSSYKNKNKKCKKEIRVGSNQ